MRYRVLHNSNGDRIAEVNAIEYHGEWMGERYITASIQSPYPLNLEVGSYIIYRGERFELSQEPSIQKQAKINTYGQGFMYENVKFNSLTDELVRCLFFDCVSSEDITTVGASSKFSFYCPDVSELGRRIQANLDRLYTGSKKWTIRMAEGYIPTTDKEMNQSLSADNINCWNALAMAYEQMGVKFIVEKTARTITLGTSGTVHNVLRFGKGRGLRKISKTAKQDQNIVTKVRAYGNTTNLPQHYYYYKAIHCVAPLKYVEQSYDGYDIILGHYCIETPFGVSSTTMLFMIRNDNYEVSPGRYTHQVKVTSNGAVVYEGSAQLQYDAETNSINCWSMPNSEYPNPQIEIKTANKHYIPIQFKSSDIPNEAQLIPIQNLMLPGFPKDTLDPFVVSDRIEELGVREAVVYFDGSNDLDDIYPTMVGMTMDELEKAGEHAYIANEDRYKAKKDIRLDAVLDASRKPNVPISKAEDYFNNALIDDDGIFDDEESFSDADGHFLIRIRNIGFDLASADIKLSATEYPVISMKDGMCGGRDFNVVDCKLSTDKTYYTLQCERVKDDSLNQFFPNKNALIKAEDKFVLTNINMPDIYINTASVRLEVAARAWLAENDMSTYQISVELDNIFLARQHDDAIKNRGISLHDTIKEGDILAIEDEDCNIDELIEIANLTIKEGANGVPEYSVTLNSDKTSSTIQRIQNTISGIVNGNISIPGMSVSQIKDIVNNAIKNLKIEETYLNKKTDDTAKGNYVFEGDIEFGDPLDDEKRFIPNIQGLKLYWNGNGWCINTDYLNVTKKATFTQLEIQKVTHIGGQQLLTACGCKVNHVFKEVSGTTTYYYVFYDKKDADGNAITDDWVIGDLAYCQSFNVGEGTSVNVGSRYYWVRVISKAKPEGNELTSMEGEKFNPQDFYCLQFRYNNSSAYSDHPSSNITTPCVNTTKASCDYPKKGDNIVQFGNITDESRQGATLLAGAGNWGQALIMWRGIGANRSTPFIMPEPSVQISPQKVSITADEMKLSSKGKLELSSNQLECTNEEGAKTMWLDDKGNVNIAGILNRASIDISGDAYDYFFNRVHNDDADVPLIIRNNFTSDNDEFLDKFPDRYWLIPDMFRLDGVVTLENQGGDEQATDMLLPFVIPVSCDNMGNNQHYDVCRLATSNGGTKHLITWNELNSIVGRKITIYNNGGNIDIHYPNLTDRTTYKGTKMIEQYEFSDYAYERISNGQSITIEMLCTTVMYKKPNEDPTYGLGIFPRLQNIVTHATPEGTDEWDN